MKPHHRTRTVALVAALLLAGCATHSAEAPPRNATAGTSAGAEARPSIGAAVGHEAQLSSVPPDLPDCGATFEDPEAAGRALAPYAIDLGRCMERQWERSTPATEGALEVWLRVDMRGHIADVGLDPRTPRDLARCVRGTARAHSAPEPVLGRDDNDCALLRLSLSYRVDEQSDSLDPCVVSGPGEAP